MGADGMCAQLLYAQGTVMYPRSSARGITVDAFGSAGGSVGHAAAWLA